jgi:drug/metabolite transporter (DMT)-like permease
MNIPVLSLLFVTVVWGATFPVLKVATTQLSGVETSALRFLLAALCMLPWAVRAPRAAWRDGALLGALVLSSYVAQAFGLQFISSNRSAFLTSLNVLMVPLLGVVFGNTLSWRIVLAALLACAGIGLMSWDGGGNLLADAATVAGALGYALYVIVLSARAGKHAARDLAATQIVWMAVLGGLWMLVDAIGTDRQQTLGGRLNAEILWGLAYLGIVATAGMLFLQARAQAHVSADKAALIYAMEPVFAALFAWIWLSEGLTLRAALGGAVVVFAVVFSEWKSVPR